VEDDYGDCHVRVIMFFMVGFADRDPVNYLVYLSIPARFRDSHEPAAGCICIIFHVLDTGLQRLFIVAGTLLGDSL
jgi:hypothetical protein